MKRISSIALSILAAGAIAIGVTACSGSGDDVASPTPVPVNVDFCQISWQAVGQDSNHYNEYRVVMLTPRWTAGANNYNDTANVFGIFAYGIPTTATNLNQAQLLATATNGDFSVTATGTQENNTVTFSDTTAQAYTFVGTDFQTKIGHMGQGGDGDFNGVFSDPHRVNPPVLGTGNVHFAMVNGSNLTWGSSAVGGGAVFAICHPMAIAQHSGKALTPGMLQAVPVLQKTK